MFISPEQEVLISRVFETYLTEHHHGDILQLIADTNEDAHHSIFVNAMTLFEASMEIGDYFIAYPSDVLAIFDKVLGRTTMTLSEKASSKHYGALSTRQPKLKRTPHARITGLPVCPELTRDTIPRSRDVGHFLSVTGTVIRTSVAKVLEYERDYMCTKCHHVFTLQADFEQFYTFDQLMTCPNPDGCNSNKFSCLSGGSEPAACKDYQEIKIQEQVQRLSLGSIPRSMVVVLEDNLVDSCKSGDDVTVYGVMCQRWKPFYDGTACNVELVLKANNIEVNNQQAGAALIMKDVQKEFEDFWNTYKHDRIAGRNQILLSLCPQVFGMYLIKLAVAMVLAGGVQRMDSSGTKIRGECHMLLVGDPGTGKSQFLKYAAKIIPRSVLTAGIGSTSAGLTVAAVKDGADWHLEAGALVLSDGGLCCIDEFNSIKEQDRISIHEAMEQQSISVAKAGMVCKLNTRTSILAATNPKGQYDPNEPLSINVALASPLLSRFDLVLILMDTREAEWDHVISTFILEDRGLIAESASLWTVDKMKAYFSVIKNLQPQMSKEANSILTRYYQLQRQSDGRNTARTTVRMLESLSRLAEAHARLMYRETVTVEDAVMAVSVMECSMQGGSLLGNVNALFTSFPTDPDQHYQAQCQILLEGLNLPLLLKSEMDRLARLKSNTSGASPPMENYHHQLRDTTPVNKTYKREIKLCKGDGLEWFHSIHPSLLPGDLASPILTSTQEPLKRKSNSSWSEMSDVRKKKKCQTEKAILGATSIALITSASEDENQAIQKIENIAEKRSLIQAEMKQSEGQKDQNCPESFGSVFQKVSKNLRDQRLGELVLKHQQCEKVPREEFGDRVMSTKTIGKNVNAALDTISETHTSNKLSPCRNFAENISAGIQKKLLSDDETRNKIQAKLSGFIFQPQKMSSSVQNPNVTAQFHTECYPHIHTDVESKISKKKLFSHDDSANPETDKEKNKRLNQSYSVCEDGSMRKQTTSVGDMGDSRSDVIACFTSKELYKDVFYFDQSKLADNKTIGKLKRKDTENMSQQQRIRVNSDDATCIPSSKPHSSISNLQPFKTDHTKFTVSTSTQNKLKRFSFLHNTEPTTTGQMKVEKNFFTGVEKSQHQRDDDHECLRGDLKDKTKKILKQGTELSSKEMLNYNERQVYLTHSANHNKNAKTVNDFPADFQNAGSVNKKKCFVLGPPPCSVVSSSGTFSGLSLFDSVELGNDVLNTDWDQEFSKTDKI